jgi:hypothetical protein
LQVLLADLETVREAEAVDVRYDLVATGHVMAQLVLGDFELQSNDGGHSPALAMSIYPATHEEKMGVREALARDEPPRVHGRLIDAALAACTLEEADEHASGIKPTTREFLAGLLHCDGAQPVASAKTGWELLIRSPSMHGPTEATTALDVCDDGASVVYLDRHKVFPSDYCSVLVGFRLERGGTASNVQYRYWRKRLAPADAVQGLALSCHLSNAVDVSVGGGGLMCLVGLRVRVADTPGVFLKGFQLQPLDAAGNPSATSLCYRFWSVTTAALPHVACAPVVESATEWNEASDSIFYLDRHRVLAPSGHTLKGFVLEARACPGAAAVQMERMQLRVKFWSQEHGHV